jgi:hypothetical protein
MADGVTASETCGPFDLQGVLQNAGSRCQSPRMPSEGKTGVGESCGVKSMFSDEGSLCRGRQAVASIRCIVRRLSDHAVRLHSGKYSTTGGALWDVSHRCQACPLKQDGIKTRLMNGIVMKGLPNTKCCLIRRLKEMDIQEFFAIGSGEVSWIQP